MNSQLLVFLLYLFIFTAFGIVNAMLEPFWSALGFASDTAKYIMVILFAAAATGIGIVAAPIWGRLTPRLGIRRTLALALIGFSLGYLVMASIILAIPELGLAAGVLGVIIIAIRMFIAATFLGLGVAGQTLIAQSTDETNRTKGTAVMSAGQSLGYVIGPVLGTVLILHGLSTPFFAAAGLGILALGLLFASMKRSPKPTEVVDPPRPKLNDPRYSGLLFVGFSLTFGMIISQIVGGFFYRAALLDDTGMSAQAIQERVAQVTGWSLAIAGSVAVFCQGVIRLWKPSAWTLMWIGIPAGILGNVLIMLSPATIGVVGEGFAIGEVTAMFVGYGVVGIAVGFAFPGFVAGITLSVRDDEQSAAAGLTQVVQFLGALLGPIAGLLVFLIHPSLSYGVVALALTVSLGVLIRVRSKPTRLTTLETQSDPGKIAQPIPDAQRQAKSTLDDSADLSV